MKAKDFIRQIDLNDNYENEQTDDGYCINFWSRYSRDIGDFKVLQLDNETRTLANIPDIQSDYELQRAKDICLKKLDNLQSSK